MTAAIFSVRTGAVFGAAEGVQGTDMYRQGVVGASSGIDNAKVWQAANGTWPHVIDELIGAAAEVPVLKALLRIAEAVLRPDSFAHVLEVIAEQTVHALGAASVSICRWERDRNALQTLINVGDLGPHERRWPPDEFYYVAAESDVAELLHNGRSYTHHIDDPDCPQRARTLLEDLGKECELAVPIMARDAMWGEVWVSGAGGRRFDHGDAQLLQAVAAFVAIAIGRSELISTIWGYAFEDPLTGLANRRALSDFCDGIEWGQVDVVALVCDLDGFKQVNDQSGHPAGDQLLRDVATVLSQLAQTLPGALVARLGGDEFCLLVPDATMAHAQELAKCATRDIREAVGGLVSVSWGAAATRDRSDCTGDELLGAADAALLEAKRHGPAHFSSVVISEHLPLGGRDRGNGVHRGTQFLTDSVVRILGENPRLSHLEALEVLAIQMQRAANTCAYALSVVSADGASVATARKMDIVREPDSDLAILTDLGVDGGELADYPETERAISEASTFFASRDDESSDPSEVALLEVLGYRAVLGVGVHAAENKYLVEFYCNTDTEQLRDIAPLAQVLAHYCVSRPPVGISGADGAPRRREHESEVPGPLPSRQ